MRSAPCVTIKLPKGGRNRPTLPPPISPNNLDSRPDLTFRPSLHLRFDRPPSRDRAEWTRGGRGGGRSPSPPPRGRWDDRGRDRSRDRSWDRGAPAYGGDGDRFPQRRSPVRYERDWVDRDRDDRGYQTQQQPRGYDEGYPQRQQQRGGYDRPRSEEGNNRGENFHRGGGDGAGGGQWDNGES